MLYALFNQMLGFHQHHRCKDVVRGFRHYGETTSNQLMLTMWNNESVQVDWLFENLNSFNEYQIVFKTSIEAIRPGVRALNCEVEIKMTTVMPGLSNCRVTPIIKLILQKP